MAPCHFKKGSVDVVEGKLVFRDAHNEPVLQLSKEETQTLHLWLTEHVLPRQSVLWVLCARERAEQVATLLKAEYDFQGIALEPQEEDTRWVTIPLHLLYQPGDPLYQQKVDAMNAFIDALPGVVGRRMNTTPDAMKGQMITY